MEVMVVVGGVTTPRGQSPPLKKKLEPKPAQEKNEENTQE